MSRDRGQENSSGWRDVGSWINSGAIHEAKKRRATQEFTCSFPCGKWLHMIGARSNAVRSVGERETTGKNRWKPYRKKRLLTYKARDVQRKVRASVIGAHNKCWKYLICTITKMGRRNEIEISNSLGKTKTDDWSRFGGKRKSETSYPGRTLQMSWKGCWL